MSEKTGKTEHWKANPGLTRTELTQTVLSDDPRLTGDEVLKLLKLGPPNWNFRVKRKKQGPQPDGAFKSMSLNGQRVLENYWYESSINNLLSSSGLSPIRAVDRHPRLTFEEAGIYLGYRPNAWEHLGSTSAFPTADGRLGSIPFWHVETLEQSRKALEEELADFIEALGLD